MTSSTTRSADLDRLSRFTFAGRGCRDPRRERRRPAALSRPAAPASLRAPGPSGPAPPAGSTPASPDTGAVALAASGTTGGRVAPGDRPPPPATHGRTGVRLPGYSGNRTPVGRGAGRGRALGYGPGA